MSHEPKLGYLPIFKSPLLTDDEQTSLTHHGTHSSHDSVSQPGKTMHHHSEERDDEGSQDDYLNDRPAFRRHAEATNAELFYDLFFVANLTVFTNIHELNDIKPLKQFIGFFAIIWMTWYQVSLYDVRFGTDSVADRVAKAVQFGVMIGFAVIGPHFNVGTPKTATTGPNWEDFKALCLVLMVSRLILVAQYIQALFFVRKFHKVKTPLGLIAGTYAVASIIYLGLYFTFSPKSSQSYVAWYIVAFAETVLATAVSSFWRTIGFKGTHLVQRMSLLTLIFIGEGIIIAAKKTQLIFGTTVFGPTPANIGNVICCILILYFLYMLYFDWIEEEHFGTIRQQIWAFLHFPLHLAIVVGTEGSGQVLTWTAATESTLRLTNMFVAFPYGASKTDWKAAVKTLKDVAKPILKKGVKGVTYDTLAKYNNNTKIVMKTLDILPNMTDPTSRQLWTFQALGPLFEMTYDIAGFAPPHNESSDISVDTDPLAFFDNWEAQSAYLLNPPRLCS